MQSVFEHIKDRLSITDVLSSYITITGSGSSLKAKCPFHNERSASFSISPDRGLYYCFGCGAKGDIFTFVEAFEGVDKKGALRILAERAGVVLTNDTVARENTDAVYELLETVTTRYQHELARAPSVLAYLHERGLTDATISAFRIGYVPDVWRYVADTMRTQDDAKSAVRAGLIKESEKQSVNQSTLSSKYYDRFRKRVMFPLAEASGRIVGFSGRLYPSEGDTQNPKYLNSPETELFQKSRILFGFDKAKAAIRTHGFAVLVEGQMDCVLAHQAGFKNTVATSGTAVSEQAALDPTTNLRVLSRLTPHVFLAFDGDAAGQKALDHAALVALSLGMNPKVVPLPEGMDPADYIKLRGAEGWKALLKESRHFILHQVARINRHELSPHVLVQTLRDRVFPFLARITSPIEQGTYLESISTELDIPKQDLVQELALFTSAQPSIRSVARTDTTTAREGMSTAERFVALISRYPSEHAEHVKATLTSLAFETYQFTLPVLADEASAIARIEGEYGALTPDERAVLVTELAHTLTTSFYTTIRTTLTKELAAAEKQGDDTETARILAQLHTLSQRRHTPM